MNLGKVLASSCRQRILKTLSKHQSVAMMRLVHTVNGTYNEVDRNLHILEIENLVDQEYLGHKRIIRLNFQNKKTLVLLETLRMLDSHIDLDQIGDYSRFIIEQPQ